MANTGCPKSRNFEWQTGYRFQDLEDSTKLTKRTKNFHLAAHIVSGDVDQMFCIKDTVAPDNELPLWPKGRYCIYQRGIQCPATDGSFEAGFVLWDDENGSGSGKNLNRKCGTLPAGQFDNDTLIKFCCQVNGSQDNPINLPTDDPFYLIFYKEDCQEVLGTFHIKENICFDTEETDNHDTVKEPYPVRAIQNVPCIDYCYYQRKLRNIGCGPGFHNFIFSLFDDKIKRGIANMRWGCSNSHKISMDEVFQGVSTDVSTCPAA